MKRIKSNSFFKHIVLAVVVLMLPLTSFAATQIVIWEQMEPSALKEFKMVVREFNKEHKDIKVVLKHYGNEELRTNYQTASLAKSGPDLVYGPDDIVGLFTVSGLLAPVDQFVSPKFLARFDQKTLSSASYKGKMYGLPDLNGNHIALIYNKKFVKKAPTTWDEFVAEAQKHQKVEKAAKDSTYGFVFNIKEPFWFIGFYNGFGGSAFDEKGEPSLNNKAMVEALTTVRDIRGKYNLGLNGMDYDISNQLFAQGKAAFILQGSWAWGEYSDLDIGITYLPLPDNNKAIFYSSTKGFMISNATATMEKKAEIETFMEYIFTDKTHKRMALAQKTIPTITAVVNDPDIQKNFLISSGAAMLEYTTPMPNVPEIRAVWDGIRPSLESVVDGKLEPKAAAAQIQKDAVKYKKTILGQ